MPTKEQAETLKGLAERLQRLVDRRQAGAQYARFPQYRGKPAEYVRKVLHQEPTPDQIRVLDAVTKPPYRVLVASGHSCGKTALSAWLTNYHYDCIGPSIAITTAPTLRDVVDLLWAEVRIQRRRVGLDSELADKAPHMGANEEHYAKGFTSRRGESFQGRHRDNMGFFFDEAVGIEPTFWTTANSMFKPNGKHLWVCVFNPTDISSQAYQEWTRGGWTCISMSSLDHPNIAAELAGRPAPIPGAVDVSQVRDWLLRWFDPIPASDADPARDVEFPPGSGQWHRPGPLGESRVLGRWPTQAVNSVWSQGLWQMVCAVRRELPPGKKWPVVIGCDPARMGDDRTAICVRWGLWVVAMEAHNGWEANRTAGRLRHLCHEWGQKAGIDPKTQVQCVVDASGGLGSGGIVDHADGYNWVAINSSCVARKADDYPNVRTELWFNAVLAAKEGAIDVSRLPHAIRDELGRELMAPTYTIDAKGRRVVEAKELTKKRLRRSPDLADAFQLSLYSDGGTFERVAGHVR